MEYPIHVIILVVAVKPLKLQLVLSPPPLVRQLSPCCCSYRCSSLSPESSNPSPSFYNVGTGKDITIRQAAEIICDIVGDRGETIYDADKPDGTPQKLLDTTRINAIGWEPTLTFREGLHDAYKSYLNN